MAWPDEYAAAINVPMTQLGNHTGEGIDGHAALVEGALSGRVMKTSDVEASAVDSFREQADGSFAVSGCAVIDERFADNHDDFL